MAYGFVMGSADIVPGVSGGTVALVLGIYGRLIENIQRGASALRSLLSRDGSAAISKATSVEWGWLLSLLAGILIAIATLSALLEQLLEEHAIRTSAVFLGLIAGSIVVASQLIRDRNVAHVGIAIVAPPHCSSCSVCDRTLMRLALKSSPGRRGYSFLLGRSQSAR